MFHRWELIDQEKNEVQSMVSLVSISALGSLHKMQEALQLSGKCSVWNWKKTEICREI